MPRKTFCDVAKVAEVVAIIARPSRMQNRKVSMPTTSNDEIQILFATVIERLEKDPVEFVEALIDLLAAPERKREPRLRQALLLQVWLLLEFPEQFAHSTFPITASKTFSSPRLTRYEQLIELMCNVIEREILRHLALDQERISLNSKMLQQFWGGLALHIKLALPLEPCRGTALYSNGVVTTSNAKSLPCEPPLSESQIYALLTHLGHSFILEYVNAYIHIEQLCRAIAQFAQPPKNKTPSKNDSVPFQLIVQERTLNRYVDKFARRLAAHFRDACKRFSENPSGCFHDLLCSSSPESLLSEWVANASDALCINPKPFELHDPEPIAQQPSAQVQEKDSFNSESRTIVSREFDYRKTLETFTRFQAEWIRDSIETVFVSQDLIWLEVGNKKSQRTEIGELANSTNPHLIVAASPGGGKTRLLQEILLLPHPTHAYQLYVNVAEFSVPRFRTFHHFAANEILTRIDSDRRDILKLENDLLMLDMDGDIVWYLDNWDSNCQRESSSASNFAGLGKFILATSNPSLAMEQLSSNGVAPSGFVEIQPFTQTQIAEFMKTNSPNQNPARTRIERRAWQLPGLARMPDGLQYICAHLEQETVVDVLLGFINSHLEKNKESPFSLVNLDQPNLAETISESSALGSGFLIVKALLNRTRGAMIDFNSFGADTILPYMGASNQVENRRLASERIGRAVQGKLLQVNDDGRTFQLVVPEIAYLFASLDILSQHRRKHWLNFAVGQFRLNPRDPFYQMMLALGVWGQESSWRLHRSASEPLGTTVPIRIETPTRM